MLVFRCDGSFSYASRILYSLSLPSSRDMQEEGKVREAMKTLLEALQKDDRTKELTLLHFTDWHAPEALLGEPPSKKQRVDADAE